MAKKVRMVKGGVVFVNMLSDIESDYRIQTGREPPSRADITNAIAPLVRRRREEIIKRLLE